MNKQQQLNKIDGEIDHLIDLIAQAQTLNTDSNGNHFYSDFEKFDHIATLHHRMEVLQAKSAGLNGSFVLDEQVAFIKEIMVEIDLMTITTGSKKETQTVIPYPKLIALFKKYGYDPGDELPF